MDNPHPGEYVSHMETTTPAAYLVAEQRFGSWTFDSDHVAHVDTLEDAAIVADGWRSVGATVGVFALTQVS